MRDLIPTDAVPFRRDGEQARIQMRIKLPSMT